MRTKNQDNIDIFNNSKLNETKNTVSKDWIMVAVIDLSVGDIFFYARRSLEIGKNPDLKIDFSTSLPSIKYVGKVFGSSRHIPPPYD